MHQPSSCRCCRLGAAEDFIETAREEIGSHRRGDGTGQLLHQVEAIENIPGGLSGNRLLAASVGRLINEAPGRGAFECAQALARIPV